MIGIVAIIVILIAMQSNTSWYINIMQAVSGAMQTQNSISDNG